MKVIRHGNAYKPQEIKCPECKALLEYIDRDVEVCDFEFYGLFYENIVCPECGKVIYLTARVLGVNRAEEWNKYGKDY